MDFVVGLSKTLEDIDSIWVVVNKIIKSDYFILLIVDYNTIVGKDLCEEDSKTTWGTLLYHLKLWYLIHIEVLEEVARGDGHSTHRQHRFSP